MQDLKSKIVWVGAGNVATHLGLALQAAGFPVLQVYSHTLASASRLGELLHTEPTDNLQAIRRDADLYIFSVKDSVLGEVLSNFPKVEGMLIHTAGSLPMDVFAGYGERYGVLYPLQTFSKDRQVSFEEIPLFIEANLPGDEAFLKGIASALSSRITVLSSEKRKYLHLAAVFACNFVNHQYALAAEILESQQIPWDYLLPLIKETASKVETLHPRAAQTGPAVRYDRNVMDKHLELLDEKKRIIYDLLSKSIFETNKLGATP